MTSAARDKGEKREDENMEMTWTSLEKGGDEGNGLVENVFLYLVCLNLLPEI